MFVTWVGDHAPKHVHVYEDRRLVLKWDLEHDLPMQGRADSKLIELIRELREEGRL